MTIARTRHAALPNAFAAARAIQPGAPDRFAGSSLAVETPRQISSTIGRNFQSRPRCPGPVWLPQVAAMRRTLGPPRFFFLPISSSHALGRPRRPPRPPGSRRQPSLIRIAVFGEPELFFQRLQGDYIFDRDRHNSRNATLLLRRPLCKPCGCLASDTCHAIEPSQRKAVEGFGLVPRACNESLTPRRVSET